jgi:MFS family permease
MNFMLIKNISQFMSCKKVHHGIFVIGATILLLGLTYPLFGALSNRDMPVEIDDSGAYIQRGIQTAICPLQDCRALEDLRPVLEAYSPDAETAFSRRDIFTRVLQNHIPLYAFLMSLFYQEGIGPDYYVGYYGLQAATALILWLSIGGFLLVQFGPAAGGMASVLVAATYFGGQGLINLVPVTLGWSLPLMAMALLMHFGNRALLAVAILALLTMGLHIIGKVYVVLFLLFYILRGSRPDCMRDYISLAVIAGGTLLAFILPHLFHRPSFDNPAAAHVVVNMVEGIKDNILGAPRLMLRSTLMVGGLIPMLMIGLIVVFRLTGQKQRDFIVLTGLFGVIAFVSLLHVHSHYPADLFARTWIPFAIIMTGACAFLFLELVQFLLSTLQTSSEAISKSSLPFLEPMHWRKLTLIIVFMMTVGFGYQVAQGVYAMYRAKIMYTHRQDFTMGREQVDIVTKDCKKILYFHKDAMLTYFATGALNCGAVYYLAYNKDEWASAFSDLAPEINYAVTMNQMGQWKGWQPIGGTNPAQLSFWRENAIPVLRMRIRNSGGPATLSLRNGTQEIVANIKGYSVDWVSFDTSKINSSKTYEIVTSTTQLELGGLRLDRDSTLYWPWDQGVVLSYHRSIPYQFTSDITFRYDSREVFPVMKRFEIVNDHEATLLGRAR